MISNNLRRNLLLKRVPLSQWQNPTTSRGDTVPKILIGTYRVTTPTLRFKSSNASMIRRTITSDIRTAIAVDLRSVDINRDGHIDAKELGDLLRKHNDQFKEEEIAELCELYYTGTGGSSVSIDKFLDALDAAAAGGGSGEQEKVQLATIPNGKFKTHPLGIGTCASEYM
jgi:hypothetical protein